MKPKLKWKDETSFSRSDTDRTPRTWAAQVGGVRLVVTRSINLAPSDWLLSFHHTPLRDDVMSGIAVSAEDAQVEAERIFAAWLKRTLAQVTP